jgi:hypothetical protein
VIITRTYAREAAGKTERLAMTTVAASLADHVDALTRPIAARLEADGYALEEES